MDNGKRFDFQVPELEVNTSDTAPRARNRTVMLNPEITGQVRARLLEDPDVPPAEPPQLALGAPQPADLIARESTEVPRAPAIDAAEPESAWVRPVPKPAPPPEPESGPEESPYFERPGMRSTANAAAPLVEPGSNTIYAKETPIVGFLVSYDRNPNGEVIPLRTGRLVITSQPLSSGSYVLLRDEGVSPSHAILRISGQAQVQVLDQLSEAGTRIQRFGSEQVEELVGDKTNLDHGDCLIIGPRAFYCCLLPLQFGPTE